MPRKPTQPPPFTGRMYIPPGLHPFVPGRPQGEIIVPRPRPAGVTEKITDTPAPQQRSKKNNKVAKIVGGVLGGIAAAGLAGLGIAKYDQMKQQKMNDNAGKELSDAYNKIAPILAKGGGMEWKKKYREMKDDELFFDAVSDIS